MSNDKQKTLSYIQEMFKDRVDDESIKLVFAQCQYNGNKNVFTTSFIGPNFFNKNVTL